MGAAEHKERWADAKAMTIAEAMAAMPEIERKYGLECAEYANVDYGINDEFAGLAKLETEKIAKLSDAGELQALLDSGSFVAVEEFDSHRDKAVDIIMATKTSLDRKK